MAENLESGNSTGAVTIGVVKETAPGETRVALIPDSVKHLVGKGLKVVIESGAGEGSSIADDEYREQGATVVDSANAVYADADVMLRVQAPSGDRGELDHLKPDQVLVSFLAPLVNHDLNRQLAESGVTAMAVDAVPRITRAQSMDALSAMSTISGYKAAVLAADHLPKFFPLLMTAAGTIRPAKVLVLGAGVAGLQAIATARRLGAVVEAYDVRAVVKEQVESLGAKFVEIDTGADAEAAGGYAREATPEELKKQQEGLNDHIANADVVITTALVPGRPAPKMIPESAVERMRTGSVIVDLAAETGGNCELTTPGEITTEHGVTIIGLLNLPATLPVHGSQMYGKVMTNFLDLLVKDGSIDLNFDDEIIAGMCITHQGEIVQAQTRKMMGMEETATPVAAASSEADSDSGKTSVEADASEDLSAVDTDKLSDLENDLAEDSGEDAESAPVVAEDDSVGSSSDDVDYGYEEGEVGTDLNQEETTYGAISGDSYGSTADLAEPADSGVDVVGEGYPGAAADTDEPLVGDDPAEPVFEADSDDNDQTGDDSSSFDSWESGSDADVTGGVADKSDATGFASCEAASEDDAGEIASDGSGTGGPESWTTPSNANAMEGDSGESDATGFDSWEVSSAEVGQADVFDAGSETSETGDEQHTTESAVDSFIEEGQPVDTSTTNESFGADDIAWNADSENQHDFGATGEGEDVLSSGDELAVEDSALSADADESAAGISTNAGSDGVTSAGSAHRSTKLPATGEGTDWVAGDGTSNIPAGFPLKGNANSMIYHSEASPSYNETIAEIYFANDDAAVAHGYRLPKSMQHSAESAGSSAFDSTSDAAPDQTDHGSSSYERNKKLPTFGEGNDWVAGDGTQNVPDGFPLKGNANSMIYHPHESHSYEQTIAEIYFANDEAAVAHGYRLPKALQQAAEAAGETAQSAAEDVVDEMRNRSNQVDEENSNNE